MFSVLCYQRTTNERRPIKKYFEVKFTSPCCSWTRVKIFTQAVFSQRIFSTTKHCVFFPAETSGKWGFEAHPIHLTIHNFRKRSIDIQLTLQWSSVGCRYFSLVLICTKSSKGFLLSWWNKGTKWHRQLNYLISWYYPASESSPRKYQYCGQ